MSLSNLFPDPFNTVSPWSQEMSTVSHSLFIFLFVIELAVLGVQSLYFKDSVYEYIKMFAGKVLIGSVAIALLANANLIFPTIVGMFVNVAQTISNGGPVPPASPTCMNNEAFTCVAAPSNSDIVVTMLGWAVTYFVAGNVSLITDGVLSIASGILFGIPFPPDPGNGDAGLPMAFMLGHGQFQIACFGLGMLCITAALGVTLTYYLLMFETCSHSASSPSPATACVSPSSTRMRFQNMLLRSGRNSSRTTSSSQSVRSSRPASTTGAC